MIVYDENEKVLIIPNGLGNGTSGSYEEGLAEGIIQGKQIQEVIDATKLTEVELTENGEFNADYGYKKVTVNVDSSEAYDEGYAEGFNDGEYAQKAKLGSRTIYTNGTYTSEDGWNEVKVAILEPKVQDVREYTLDSDTAEIKPTEMAVSMKKVMLDATDYVASKREEGKTEGIEEQKAKLESIEITENGTYNKEDGYNSIVVNVPQGEGYDEGYAAGEIAQKAKLEAITVTQNGTYAREDGYRSISVNVPNRYQEGYNAGKTAGKTERQNDIVNTIRSLNPIVSNGAYDIVGSATDTLEVNVPQFTQIDYTRAAEGVYLNPPMPINSDYNAMIVFECVDNGVLDIGGDADEMHYDYSEISTVNSVRRLASGDYYYLEGDFEEGNYYQVWFKCPSVVAGYAMSDSYAKSLILPSTVTELQEDAFKDNEISLITCYAMTAPTLGGGALRINEGEGTLRVPSGATGYNAWLTRLGSGWTLEYMS